MILALLDDRGRLWAWTPLPLRTERAVRALAQQERRELADILADAVAIAGEKLHRRLRLSPAGPLAPEETATPGRAAGPQPSEEDPA